MNEKIIEWAREVRTPISLISLFFIILYLIIKSILLSFGSLDAHITFQIIDKILNFGFYFSCLVLLLGIGAFLYDRYIEVQDRYITGHVQFGNGIPVSEANVSVLGLNRAQKTDESGWFSIDVKPSKQWIVKAWYEETSAQVLVLRKDIRLPVILTLPKVSLVTDMAYYFLNIQKRYSDKYDNDAFIEPVLEIGEDEVQGADKILEELNRPDAPAVYFVTGEFGTGKSWLMARTEYLLAKQWSESGENRHPLFPIYYDLSGREVFHLEQVLTNACKQNGFDKTVIQSRPEEIVYILDSLDEASRNLGMDAFRGFLREVMDHASSNNASRILVASRKAFFEETMRDIGIIHEHPRSYYQEIQVKFWTIQQIEEYINAKTRQYSLNKDAREKLVCFARQRKGIAGRALTIAVLLEHWEVLYMTSEGGELDEYTIFDTVILSSLQQWASRVAVVGEPLVDKLHTFIRVLAISFLKPDSNQRISTSELQKHLRLYFEKEGIFSSEYERNSKAEVLLLRQVRTRSLLEITDDGSYYRFCHSQIWEFIVAQLVYEYIFENKKGKLRRDALKRLRSIPVWYESIYNNFLYPISKKQGKLDKLDKFLGRKED